MRRLVVALAVTALAAAGATAGLATAAKAPKKKAKPVAITVTAREFSFTFSKRSVPAGSTVVFNVVNKGKISHDFKIAGKKTKSLAPGQSAKLTVKFPKKGQFAYLCTLPGHAQAGMKGKFAVGVAPVKPVPAPPPATTTTAAPAPPPPPAPPPTTTKPSAPVGTAQTTVNVNMIDYAFQLSQATIPSGQVTFVITNNGNDVHNFDIQGVKSGALIAPGKSEQWTVALPPGQYLYVCDVPFHVDKGMTGTFTVTG